MTGERLSDFRSRGCRWRRMLSSTRRVSDMAAIAACWNRRKMEATDNRTRENRQAVSTSAAWPKFCRARWRLGKVRTGLFREAAKQAHAHGNTNEIELLKVHIKSGMSGLALVCILTVCGAFAGMRPTLFRLHLSSTAIWPSRS